MNRRIPSMSRRTKSRIVMVLTALAVCSLVVVGAQLAFSPEKSAGSGVAFNASDGPRVQLGQSVNFSNIAPFPDSNTVQLNTTMGNFTATGGPGNVTIDAVSSPSLSAVDAGTMVTVNPEGSPRLGVRGQASQVSWTTVGIGDGNSDVAVSTASSATVGFYGLQPSTHYRVLDSNSNVVGGGQTSTSGRTNVTLSSSSTFTLADNSAPQVTSISPDGGVSETSVTFNASVSDNDFPKDTVRVVIDVAGQEVKNTTVSSDTQVSVTKDLITDLGLSLGGDYQWTVTVTDTAGAGETRTGTVELPDTLYIREESDPSSLVDNAQVNITFISESGDAIVRNTSDGTINMTGLPVDQEFVAVVSATNYTTRTVLIDSLLEQQSVYLLNTQSNDVVTIEFELDDKTGEYEGNGAELLVQRPLTLNGETTWRTVVGDQVGADQRITTQLKKGTRHRIVVRNEDGDTRVLGSYTPTESELVVLPIGTVSLDSRTDSGAVLQASLDKVADQRSVKIVYRDETSSTSELDIVVYEQGNKSNVIYDVTETGTWGTYKATVPVPDSAPDDVTYVVEVNATRDGSVEQHEVTVGGIATKGGSLGLDKQVRELLAYVLIAASMGLMVIIDGAIAGLVGSLVAGVLMALGFAPINPIAVGLGGSVSILYHLGRR